MASKAALLGGVNGKTLHHEGHEEHEGNLKFDGIVKGLYAVTPAKAGVHNDLKRLDPRLRGDDKATPSTIFFELINVELYVLHGLCGESVFRKFFHGIDQRKVLQ